MKRNKVTIIFIILICGFLSAQQPISSPTPIPATVRLHETVSGWNDFYQHNGMMHLHAGSEYVGSSIAYFTRGSSRLMLGLNIDLLPISTTPNYVRHYYDSSIPTRSSVLVPVWFSMKLRLTTNNNHRIAPYLIAGAGPTLGLQFNGSSDVFDSITQVNSEIGGGGFAGAGFDYRWADDWAISSDIRYNVIRLSNPIGNSDNYDGLSFYVGFVRAFGR